MLRHYFTGWATDDCCYCLSTIHNFTIHPSIRTNTMTTSFPICNRRNIKEWQCYLDTPQSIVDAVNILIEVHLESSYSPKDALKSIFPMLNTFSMYGFRDTECEGVAVEIINNYFTSFPSIHRFDYYDSSIH